MFKRFWEHENIIIAIADRERPENEHLDLLPKKVAIIAFAIGFVFGHSCDFDGLLREFEHNHKAEANQNLILHFPELLKKLQRMGILPEFPS